MKNVTNTGRRRLGIPGRPALILNPNETKTVEDHFFRDMQQNRQVLRWLESGLLEVSKPGKEDKPDTPQRPSRKPQRSRVSPALKKSDVRQPQVLPKNVSGEGVETNHLGGGWYEVFVNGQKVTDRNVRKDEAAEIAKEYE